MLQQPEYRSVPTVDASSAQEQGRIAFLVDGVQRPYGIWQSMRTLGEGLRRHGRGVALVSLQQGELPETFRQLGAEVIVLEGLQGSGLESESVSGLRECLRGCEADRRAVDAVASALRQARADGVHFAQRRLVPLAGRAARQADVVCLWEVSELLAGLRKGSLDRFCYSWMCRKLGIQPIATSEHMAQNLGRFFAQPQVVPLGVDVQRFDPARVDGIQRRELNIPAQAIVFAIAAHMDPSHGQERFLRAMLDVRELDGQPLHLIIMGGPVDCEYAELLRQQARQARAEDRLHLVGPVERPEEYYPAVDIAVNSRIEAEPFGLSVVEAMAMERPALVHALGGPAETVLDGVTGWHVLRAGSGDFRRGIVRAVADRHAWYTMRKAARRRVVELYSLHARAQRYLQVMEPLQKRAGGSEQK